MSARSAPWWLAWALAGLSVAMFVASLSLYLLARSAPCPRRRLLYAPNSKRTTPSTIVNAPPSKSATPRKRSLRCSPSLT